MLFSQGLFRSIKKTYQLLKYFRRIIFPSGKKVVLTKVSSMSILNHRTVWMGANKLQKTCIITYLIWRFHLIGAGNIFILQRAAAFGLFLNGDVDTLRYLKNHGIFGFLVEKYGVKIYDKFLQIFNTTFNSG